MKRIALIAAVLLCALSLASYAQMTDDQVVEYVKTAMSQGKSQDEISKELLLRGVTQEQAERIRAKVQSGQDSDSRGQAFGEDDSFGRSSGAATRRGQGNNRTVRESTYEDEYFEDQRSRPQRSKRPIRSNKNRDISSFDAQKAKLAKRSADLSGMLDAAGLKGIFACGFTDEDQIPEEELGCVAIAKGLGVVQGDRSGAFRPADGATRQELAVMLYRYLSR